MTAPDVAAKLVKEESERLAAYLAGLPPDAWARPSACGDWEVRDVVAHLAGAARLYTNMASRGLHGDSSTPEGRPAPGSPDFLGSYGEVIANRSIELRKSLGDRVLAEYVSANTAFNQLFANLSPEDREKPCYIPSGVYSAKTFVEFRMLELALHGWDIRSKLEPSAPLHPESVPMLLELLPTVLHWFFVPPAASTVPRRYRFQIAATASSELDLAIDGADASIEHASSAAADLTLGCDAETFILAISGRLDLGLAIVGGQVTSTGDSSLIAELASGFSRA